MELLGDRVALAPLEPVHADALRKIVSAPEVARWWGVQDPDFPLADEPAATRFAILVGGEIAGMIQFGEETEPDYRHASIDVFLAPTFHGRGFGTDAVATLLRHLVEDRGHHRVTIDPATANLAAIRSYEKAGFTRVGVMRSAWRDPEGIWRDVLLMEHVAR